MALTVIGAVRVDGHWRGIDDRRAGAASRIGGAASAISGAVRCRGSAGGAAEHEQRGVVDRRR
ncbi:hypothetical protein LLG88_13400, partial [bacterium]|nr:hypothetical protein [bacterium]